MLINWCYYPFQFQCSLEGKFDFKIDQFLEWAKLCQPGIVRESPPFSFFFPVSAYQFSLQIYPQGQKEGTEKSKGDEVSVFLVNKNHQSVVLKYKMSVLDKAGSKAFEKSGGNTFSRGQGGGFSKFITRSRLDTEREHLLPDGSLNLRCEFTILVPNVVKYKPPKKILPPPVPTPAIIWRQSIAVLCKDQAERDFSIICAGQTFPCHKVVLAAKSEVLKKDMKSSFCFAEKKELEIKGFDPATVKEMLQFIYTGDVDQATPR